VHTHTSAAGNLALTEWEIDIVTTKKATAKEIQKERARLSEILVKAAKTLSGVDFETMPDKFEDTDVEGWVCDISSLRQILYRLADSVDTCSQRNPPRFRD
jgi:hypothetical protein